MAMHSQSPPGCAGVNASIFVCLGGPFIEHLLCIVRTFASMAKKGAGGSGSGRSSGEGVPEKGPWARAAQGTARQAWWMENRFSPGEVEELQKYFTKVLDFPAERMRESRKQWEKRSILVRSIGQPVPSEWVAKDFKIWGNLRSDSEAFPLVEDHHMIRFESEAECEAILRGGPWFTVSQLLSVEPWVTGFVPVKKTV